MSSFYFFLPLIGILQMNLFRQVLGREVNGTYKHIINNFRPLQPLHGRRVEVSSKGNPKTKVDGACELCSWKTSLLLFNEIQVL